MIESLHRQIVNYSWWPTASKARGAQRDPSPPPAILTRWNLGTRSQSPFFYYFPSPLLSVVTHTSLCVCVTHHVTWLQALPHLFFFFFYMQLLLGGQRGERRQRGDLRLDRNSASHRPSCRLRFDVGLVLERLLQEKQFWVAFMQQTHLASSPPFFWGNGCTRTSWVHF